jgi:hypothetical protein
MCFPPNDQLRSSLARTFPEKRVDPLQIGHKCHLNPALCLPLLSSFSHCQVRSFAKMWKPAFIGDSVGGQVLRQKGKRGLRPRIITSL